jgi:hypothetical protein
MVYLGRYIKASLVDLEEALLDQAGTYFEDLADRTGVSLDLIYSPVDDLVDSKGRARLLGLAQGSFLVRSIEAKHLLGPSVSGGSDQTCSALLLEATLASVFRIGGTDHTLVPLAFTAQSLASESHFQLYNAH